MKTVTKHILKASIITSLVFGFASCKKLDAPENSQGTGTAQYEQGIFISNEGSFGSGNGSISFYDTRAKSVKNYIFSLENGRPLGDVVQSIIKAGDKAYICVNGSNKIEVVDASTFEEQATITSGISSPRFMIANGTTGYASCWGNGGEIAVIDLTTNSVTASIPVGAGPERMAINNNNLYVANSGGFAEDSTITVIDLGTNTPSTIQLNAYNPSSIVSGDGNTVWVLARGLTKYDVNWNVVGHEPSMLIKINTLNNSIESSTTLFNTSHPAVLDISPDKQTLYIGGAYGFPSVYTTSALSPSAPMPFINVSNYGFFVNQNNGNLFVLEEASSSNGMLHRYSSNGSKLGEYTVGVFPNGGASRRK